MRELLVAFTLLASTGFFNFHGAISAPTKVVLMCFCIILCGVYAWQTRDREAPLPQFPRMAWITVLAGMVISIFMAFAIHGQPLPLTAVATASYLFPFLFFPILLLLNPRPKILFRYLFAIVGLSILVYIVNTLTFPNNMFGDPILEDLTRGILRIPIPYFQLLILLFFYAINQFSVDRNRLWLIFIFIAIVMILLSVIRQAILLSLSLGFLLYMQKYVWYKKLLIGTVIAAIAITIITSLPIYKSMMELSQQQYEDNTYDNKEDVRIGAWRYYALESQQENPATAVFGNGAFSLDNSAWGKELYNFSEDYKYYTADVSLAGFYFRFGLVTLVPLLYVIISAVMKRKPPRKQYLSYFVACITLESIASGIFEYFFETMILMLALYLIYCPDDEESDARDDEAGDTQSDNRLRFLRRFVTR
ncbi:MAG: hypothetical protein K2I64_00060 [Muribaculaceae bacterium]|nr:hypothetical protein [Muribaculaceae bacterium]